MTPPPETEPCRRRGAEDRAAQIQRALDSVGDQMEVLLPTGVVFVVVVADKEANVLRSTGNVERLEDAKTVLEMAIEFSEAARRAREAIRARERFIPKQIAQPKQMLTSF